MDKKFDSDFKKRIYYVVLTIIKLADEKKYNFVSEVLLKQLIRSSTSILANFVEGKSASSKKDFINYLHHSLKSTNESKVWISLLKDSDRISTEESNFIQKELKEFSKIFASSLITLKKKS